MYFYANAIDVSYVRETIEETIGSYITTLRASVAKAWNESGKYESVLADDGITPLEFVSDKERKAFLTFCEKKIRGYTEDTEYDGYGETSLDLIGIAIDALNEGEWDDLMMLGDRGGFNSDYYPAISYSERGETLCVWYVDWNLIAREVLGGPEATDHMVRYWQLRDGPEIRFDRLTARYTF